MSFMPTKSDASFLRLSHARAKSEFLTLPNWDQPAKGDNKHWSSRTARGWASGWQPQPEKKVTKTEATAGLTRRLGETSEEGQGPYRTVEPMMMNTIFLNMLTPVKPSYLKITKNCRMPVLTIPLVYQSTG
jgi:hypothetical protein